MEKKSIIKDPEIKIPAGIEIAVDKFIVKVKGPRGECEKDLSNPKIKIIKKENSVFISPSDKKPSKIDKMFINTTMAIIRNMIEGASNGFEARLKICSGHFPMSVSVDKNNVIVKNFLGEKIPRKTSIIEGIDVKIEGDIVKVTGCDKEKVGQTAAKIERACRIRGRDLRRFQDGIWMTGKTAAIKNE